MSSSAARAGAVYKQIIGTNAIARSCFIGLIPFKFEGGLPAGKYWNFEDGSTRRDVERVFS